MSECTLMYVDEHLPPKNVRKKEGLIHAFRLLYKSAYIEGVISRIKKKKIFSCHFVYSENKRQGHARGAFQEAEKKARELKCDEIWYCTPLNPILLKVLIPIGWTFTKKLGYDKNCQEWVFGYKKVLK